jgi:UDP-glucose 4-epimerase
MKRALVVGGAGFIGSHLVDALLKEGIKVCVVDNLFLGKASNLSKEVMLLRIDACKIHALDQVILQFKPDTIYNLAVMPLPHSIGRPYENVRTNIKIVQNLCEIMKDGIVKTLIQFSSSEVYGSAKYEPMCEDHPWRASTPYAASKAAGDMICLSYYRTFGCDIKILRPFNNYGPRQNAGSYAGIIPITINRIRNGMPPIIFGDGLQTRDYIYVKDTARAAVMIGKMEGLKGEVINIASGHDYSIFWLVKEIMRLMQHITPSVGEIEYQPARSGDIRRHIANVLKAKDLLGFEHQVSMEEGLVGTIDWYLKNG